MSGFESIDELTKGYSIALEKDLAPIKTKYKLTEQKFNELIDQAEYLNSYSDDANEVDLTGALELMEDYLTLENKILQIKIDLLEIKAEYDKVSNNHSDLLKLISNVKSDTLAKMVDYQKTKAQNAKEMIENYQAGTKGNSRDKGNLWDKIARLYLEELPNHRFKKDAVKKAMERAGASYEMDYAKTKINKTVKRLSKNK